MCLDRPDIFVETNRAFAFARKTFIAKRIVFVQLASKLTMNAVFDDLL